MSIEQFKDDLKRFSAIDLYNRHVLTGSCAILSDDTTHQIRRAVATEFSVDYNNTVIVGSSNLGFSIKPRKRYAPFGDESDVDIAIVCPRLFEKVWQESYTYDRGGGLWKEKAEFRKYLSRGWIRPDKLPRSDVFEFSNRWWRFFSALQIDGCPYKISGGLYHSHFFLSQYQTICIQQCQLIEE